MLYNQQTSTTTELCLAESSTNTFCAEKEITTITSYDWFDTIILFLVPITILIVVGLFKRK